ncbi:Uncharacterised protein [Mycolicibacterium vanbaalenii]|uniref:SMI1/KNR4 family protein n=1 Tax=Mycolicibacterium vanbaalenii TaxID=110539 RepID=A0A5S9R2V6_MYCVN|nr:hypothetical protein [Mycolicibacterium vanbaalenii]CAA0126839.1 Uncharacterised protein [Mycolicibacterium vanbaalenii]
MTASQPDGAHLGAEAARRLSVFDSADISPGLSAAEIAQVETDFDFEFADDHRAFLAAGLPLGDSWPDWRSATRRTLGALLALPADGVLFDVEWNEYWHHDWGRRPARMKDALRTARYRLARVPRMVPVFGHRFLPAGRGSSGHPVLSIYRTEILCCGDDLVHYVDNEFGPEPHRPGSARPTVEFWSDLTQ